jgi:hypothetical protein
MVGICLTALVVLVLLVGRLVTGPPASAAGRAADTPSADESVGARPF